MEKSRPWHLITSEYPPQTGGVSDYTRLVAAGLAAAGDEVHVWCPPAPNTASENASSKTNEPTGVFIHREMGNFTPSDLRHAGRLLDQFAAPTRLLVQWVPHGYGYRSMNVPFCLWLLKRAKLNHNRVELMVHEPSLGFGEGSWRQNLVAAVHRLMIVILSLAASRIWVSIPQWETRFRPFGIGRNQTFALLPVPSNISVVDDPSGVSKLRARYAPANQSLVGHFGAYDHYMRGLMLELIPSLLAQPNPASVLFLGKGSLQLRDLLLARHPELGPHIHAAGLMSNEDVSRHLGACDVMLQPYQDGISGRRGSVMAALAHGASVISTWGPASEACWMESKAVKLVKEDVGALVEATKSLLADPAERRRLGLAAGRLYDERFDVKRTVDALRRAAA